MTKLLFGSPEWLDALKRELNTSEAYANAAKTWEGDFYFIVEPEGAFTDTVYMYMDLWHGKCREVSIVENKDAKKPAYLLSGAYGKWKQVVTARLDPLQAMATGQLKLKGNMVMIMKHVQAAKEIVKACTRIETEFAI